MAVCKPGQGLLDLTEAVHVDSAAPDCNQAKPYGLPKAVAKSGATLDDKVVAVAKAHWLKFPARDVAPVGSSSQPAEEVLLVKLKKVPSVGIDADLESWVIDKGKYDPRALFAEKN